MKLQEIYTLRGVRLKELGFETYQEYLKSEEWKNIRGKIKGRTATKWNFCNICGSDKNLNIHHSSYKVIGQENPGNTVKLLCNKCHNDLHDLSKKNPQWSFYKTCGKMRSQRKKLGLPIFIYPKK